MNNQTNAALREKLARLSSIALTFVGITMVPAMVAVLAPANTAAATQESHRWPGSLFRRRLHRKSAASATARSAR